MIPERDRLLLLGAPGSGKSKTILDIALLLPDVTVYAFDLQGGIPPLLRAHGEVPENLHLYFPEGDETPEIWASLRARCKEVRQDAIGGDFICFDAALDYWELAKDAYIEKRYGMASGEFKEMKVLESERGRKALGFGGLETEEWDVIRAQYSSTIPQSLGMRCFANVVVTATEKTPIHYVDKKTEKLTFREANLPGPFKAALVKPAGESRLTELMDVILWLKHPTEKKWTLSTIGKNRFNVSFSGVDITDSTVWETYCDQSNRDPGRSPGRGE